MLIKKKLMKQVKSLLVMTLAFAFVVACSQEQQTADEFEEGVQEDGYADEFQEEDPAVDPFQQPEAATDVSDEELEQFAGVYAELQEVHAEFENEMEDVLASYDLDFESFQQKMMAQQNPEGHDLSDEEIENVNAASETLNQKQMEIQQESLQIIEEYGFDAQRFEEVRMAIEQDPELSQKFNEMMTM